MCLWKKKDMSEDVELTWPRQRKAVRSLWLHTCNRCQHHFAAAKLQQKQCCKWPNAFRESKRWADSYRLGWRLSVYQGHAHFEWAEESFKWTEQVDRVFSYHWGLRFQPDRSFLCFKWILAAQRLMVNEHLVNRIWSLEMSESNCVMWGWIVELDRNRLSLFRFCFTAWNFFVVIRQKLPNAICTGVQLFCCLYCCIWRCLKQEARFCSEQMTVQPASWIRSQPFFSAAHQVFSSFYFGRIVYFRSRNQGFSWRRLYSKLWCCCRCCVLFGAWCIF